jgi:dienelactone hydrolase
MYNPFTKGNYPVGVRTVELRGNDNSYTTEVWYPAEEKYSGLEALDTFQFVNELPAATQEATRDADPATGKRPLVMYWHGGYGHRREMAAMCVFLASHGFVVAAPDFPGDHVRMTYGDDPELAKTPVDASAKARPGQAAEVIELLVTGSHEFAAGIIDVENVGSFGQSLGGFTTLAVNTTSRRVKASVPIAPACGNRSLLPQTARIGAVLRLEEWRSPAATFVLTGEKDSFVILDDVRELFAKLPEPKRLGVLMNAGHIHWSDNAELIHEELRSRYSRDEYPDAEFDGPAMAKAMRPFAELCPAQHGIDVQRSVALAHFEAVLKGSKAARSFLEEDLAGTLAQRGIQFEATEPQSRKAGA